VRRAELSRVAKREINGYKAIARGLSMTPREKHDMRYIVGIAIVAVVFALIYIAFTAVPP
jgi:uncharacterized membrane protein YukC